jgi:hypothetical protein
MQKFGLMCLKSWNESYDDLLVRTKLSSLKMRRTQMKLCHLLLSFQTLQSLQGGFHTKAAQLTSILSQSLGQEPQYTKTPFFHMLEDMAKASTYFYLSRNYY